MATTVTAGVPANDKVGKGKCGGTRNAESDAEASVEGASRKMYGRGLFSTGSGFEIVFGYNVPPTEGMTLEWLSRHRALKRW